MTRGVKALLTNARSWVWRGGSVFTRMSAIGESGEAGRAIVDRPPADDIRGSDDSRTTSS
jgi:hypothetical protein